MERMKSEFRKKVENGFTLIEVLASIVILSIVLIAFAMIFVQSLQTTKSSEEVIDATYIAQREMESMYALSKETPFSNRAEKLGGRGYEEQSQNTYKKTTEDHFNVELRLKEEEFDLIRVIIRVTDEKDSRSTAQMETLLEWRDAS